MKGENPDHAPPCSEMTCQEPCLWATTTKGGYWRLYCQYHTDHLFCEKGRCQKPADPRGCPKQ